MVILAFLIRTDNAIVWIDFRELEFKISQHYGPLVVDLEIFLYSFFNIERGKAFDQQYDKEMSIQLSPYDNLITGDLAESSESKRMTTRSNSSLAQFKFKLWNYFTHNSSLAQQ